MDSNLPEYLSSTIRWTNFHRKWTLEEIDQDAKQAKEFLSWTPGKDLTSIRVGFNRRKVEFVASCMRSHSKYFFALSLPTVAYAAYFMDGTCRLISLDDKEVNMMNWIVNWCHEGGLLDGHQLKQRNPKIRLDSWIVFWCLADSLGVETLQQHIGMLILKQLREENRPSFRSINYLLSYGPYSMQCDAAYIWSAIVHSYAVRTDTRLESCPQNFVPNFRSDVRYIRRVRGLRKPGEITAFTKPPARKNRVQERRDIIPKTQTFVAVRTKKRKLAQGDGEERRDKSEGHKERTLSKDKPVTCATQ